MPRTPKPPLHSVTYPKKAINLSISTDVLEEAKAYEINISQSCEAHLRQLVNQEKERRWRIENAEYIQKYNAIIETEGLPLDEWKQF